MEYQYSGIMITLNWIGGCRGTHKEKDNQMWLHKIWKFCETKIIINIKNQSKRPEENICTKHNRH